MLYRPVQEHTKDKEQKTDLAWLRAALAFGASMSKDPERQVGACVVSSDNMRASFGYNGFPMGVPDTDENWANKTLKNAMVQHAELNALAKAPFSTQGATCYVTLQPCSPCLGALVNAGVDRVCWLWKSGEVDGPNWKYFNKDAFEIIRIASGIRCVAYPMTEVESAIEQAIWIGRNRH